LYAAIGVAVRGSRYRAMPLVVREIPSRSTSPARRRKRSSCSVSTMGYTRAF